MKKLLTTCLTLITSSLLLFSLPVVAHGNHSHHEVKPHQQGIFEDNQVQDRHLSDWTGDWQSVFPYMKKGELDMVMRYKAKSEGASKTFEEYKDYYLKGYQTDVNRIVINGDHQKMTFYKGEESVTATYHYDGYKILTYASGKKGVRFLFSAEGDSHGAPRYVQFSDHEIAPTQTEHFHIFTGDTSHEALLEEMENWPTYYPSNLDVYDIIDEMITHH